jgi:hypothetical protein
MTFFDYRKIRIGTMAVVGFVPIFFMTIAMGGLGLTWVGGASAGIFGMIVTIMIGNMVLTNNNWIKAIEKEGILLFDLNSTGIIPIGIARLKQNKLGQKLFSFSQGDEEVNRLYDREVAWTLKEPLKGTYNILREKETGKKVIQIQLEEETFTKSVFFSDYMQCLIFNSQAGNFITKSELGDQEREKLIGYLTLNEQRELRELNRTITTFTRDYANRLSEVVGGILGSNGFKIIIVIILLIAAGAIVWLYVPGVQQAVMGVPKAVTGLVPNDGQQIAQAVNGG